MKGRRLIGGNAQLVFAFYSWVKVSYCETRLRKSNAALL